MNVSDLKLNTLYKLTFPTDAQMFLEDNSTQITIVATDGDYDASTPDALLPFSGVDYLEGEGGGSFSADDHGDNNNGRATDATYILYYITTLNASECATLAQYSEECHMGNVIKISQADYNTIFNAYPNSATISTGATVTYDPLSIYLIDRPKKYRHNIKLTYQNGTYVTFSFINGNGSSVNWSALMPSLQSCGFKNELAVCPARGQWLNCLIIGIFAISSTVIGFRTIKLTNNSATTTTIEQYVIAGNQGLGSSGIIYDKVEEI